MTKNGGGRIASIELLRIVALITIIGHHVDSKLMTNFGVELFFIIGGFFLFQTSVSLNKKSTSEFIKNLWIKLFPALLIVSLFLLNWKIYKLLISLFMLSGTSLTLSFPGYGSWFVGAFFFASVFYYAVLSLFGKEKGLFWIGIVTYAAYIMIIQFSPNQTINLHGSWSTIDGAYLFVGAGLLRALANMGFGILFAAIGEYYFNKDCDKHRIVIGFVEIGLFSLTVSYLVFWLPVPIFIKSLVFASTILLLFQAKGFLSQILGKLNVHKVSRYAYGIFLGHAIPIVYFGKDPLIVYGLAIIFGVLEYHLVEVPLKKRRERKKS